MQFHTPRRRALAVAICSACVCASANAAQDPEEIVVTATRTPTSLSDTLASVSAISREDLQAQQPLDLVDVFKVTSGLDISRSGGPGSAASLYTRGTGSGHTLFLVDGQRVGSATLGSTNFQFINPEQIERIEVVRGPQGTLYGSDAIGGVIQLFSRDGSSGEDSYVTTATGSHDLFKLAAGTSGSQDNWRYGLHAAGLDTQGIDNLEDDSGNNGDDDGYRNYSLNANGGYSFANGADLALHYLESDNRNQYDSAFSPESKPYSKTRLRNVNLRGSLPINDTWRSQLSLGQSMDDSRNYDDSTGARTSEFRTERQQFFWQNDVTLLDDHLLTLGYDYYRDEVEGSEAYTETSRDNRALFAQYQGQWSLVDLVAGIREDDNEAFGKHSTGSLALGLQLGSSHRVVASWSEGFKAPTFNDLYWPAGAFSAGNPELKPEESVNTEIALRANYTRWQWSLAAFQNRVDDLIDWAAGPDLVWRPYNVSDAEITGAELSAGASLGPWALDASYTWLEPEDAQTGNVLPNRSQSNLILNLQRNFDDWWIALGIKSQGKRYDDLENSASIDGYTTLGLRMGYRFSDSLQASLRFDNLLDEDYQLNEGYNQDGRQWQLGLTWRP